MKRIVLLFFIFLFPFFISAQILDPIKWKIQQNKINDEYIELEFIADIDSGWHLYSQYTGQYYNDDGPVPTSFTFKISDYYSLLDSVLELQPIEDYDAIWDENLKYYKNTTVFTQKIKLLTQEPFSVVGEINFMLCDAEQCIFPMPYEFNFMVNSNEDMTFNKDGSLDVSSQDLANTEKYKDPLVKLNNPSTNCGEVTSSDKSLWTIFILGLLGGLIALITPCVFPMIPLTVSFFTKANKNKGIFNAIMYGVFIMLIYFLLSIPFHLLPNIDPEILNQISTNTWLNLLFFGIFMFFAFSFFGYYDIALPSKWGDKADSGSNIGGLFGIFFMALTLAIVSFSCTGPILGSLLAGTLGGDMSVIKIFGVEFKMVATKLTVGMTGFGLALGLPFALFALFPKLLDALPQSGGWLNSVKVVLGFLEVALAIKFLSNADMVEQWGLIKRETFFFLWFIIGLLTVIYLIGKIQFPHDSKIIKISKLRYVFVLTFALFTIYLFPGIFGSKLNWWQHDALSGFPPPLIYSYSYSEEEREVFYDYWEAIEYAKSNSKPVFIDFTGWACVNCRKMEENVFPEVEELLNNFVFCQLYIDEKTLLPSEEIVLVPTSNQQTKKKKLKTVGNKWSTLQAVTYMSSSQPYYVLYCPKRGLLTNPIGYTPDVEKFKKWISCGFDEFKNK